MIIMGENLVPKSLFKISTKIYSSPRVMGVHTTLSQVLLKIT